MITNPIPVAEDDSKVYARVGSEIHTYFFRKIYAGDRGVPQAMINTFFEKLHEACLAHGVEASWSPDNQVAVETLLSNLNFVSHVKPTRTRKRARA